MASSVEKGSVLFWSSASSPAASDPIRSPRADRVWPHLMKAGPKSLMALLKIFPLVRHLEPEAHHLEELGHHHHGPLLKVKARELPVVVAAHEGHELLLLGREGAGRPYLTRVHAAVLPLHVQARVVRVQVAAPRVEEELAPVLELHLRRLRGEVVPLRALLLLLRGRGLEESRGRARLGA